MLHERWPAPKHILSQHVRGMFLRFVDLYTKTLLDDADEYPDVFLDSHSSPPHLVDSAVRGDLVEVGGEVVERLEVVVGQLVQELLQPQHPFLRVVVPVRSNEHVVQIWNKHPQASKQHSFKHKCGEKSYTDLVSKTH